jgi:hypothetical protein
MLSFSATRFSLPTTITGFFFSIGGLLCRTCIPDSQPNNIAQSYPNQPTGNINATYLIVPIPIATARHVIPSRWGILEEAYRDLLPNFPVGSYPMLLQGGINHDIELGLLGLHVSDFSVRNHHAILLPFLETRG